MKKLILTLSVVGCFIYTTNAQNNKSTLNQSGTGNTATVTQVGTNTSNVKQTGASTMNNTATVSQTGKSNSSAVTMKGSLNEVTVSQTGLMTPASSHAATVTISGAGSERNMVSVTQADRNAGVIVQIAGDDNTVTTNQSGNTSATPNNVRIHMTAGNDNNLNSVTVTQSIGKGNQTNMAIDGSSNTVTVNQDNLAIGIGNKIGTYAAGGAGGIQVVGDGNTIAVTQTATSDEGNVDLNINTNTNTVSVTQSGLTNTSLVNVTLSDGNDVTITQSGATNSATVTVADATMTGGNTAKIGQLGNNNIGAILQNSGGNAATINQEGNDNATATITQDGTTGSTATLTQKTNNNSATIYQTGGGGHTATIVQDCQDGLTFSLIQDGTGQTIDFTQCAATTVTITQSGSNNTITGQTGTSTTLNISQTGNGNSLSF